VIVVVASVLIVKKPLWTYTPIVTTVLLLAALGLMWPEIKKGLARL